MSLPSTRPASTSSLDTLSDESVIEINKGSNNPVHIGPLLVKQQY